MRDKLLLSDPSLSDFQFAGCQVMSEEGHRCVINWGGVKLTLVQTIGPSDLSSVGQG